MLIRRCAPSGMCSIYLLIFHSQILIYIRILILLSVYNFVIFFPIKDSLSSLTQQVTEHMRLKNKRFISCLLTYIAFLTADNI